MRDEIDDLQIRYADQELSTKTSETADEDWITETVNWQLAQRKPVDCPWLTCRNCRTGWNALIPVCPSCGAVWSAPTDWTTRHWVSTSSTSDPYHRK